MGVLNTHKQCRCCLSTEKNMMDMFETLLFAENCEITENVKLIDGYFIVLTGLLSEQADKKGSFQICRPCYNQLQSSFTFRELCKKSDEQIQKSFIKKEEIFLNKPEYTSIEDDEDENPILSVVHKEEVKAEPQSSDDNDDHDHLPDDNDDHQLMDSDSSASSVYMKPEPKKRPPRKTRKKTSKKALRTEVEGAKPSQEGTANIDQATGLWIDHTNLEVKLENSADDGHYYCIFCDKKFENLVELQYHRRKKHNSKQYRLRKKCLLCSKESMQQYEEHLVEFHPEFQPNKCVLCPQTYQNYRELKTHMNMHVTGHKFKCFGCGLFCKSALFLRTHIANTNHGGVTVAGNFLMKTSYNCPFCGLPFEKIIPLSEHIKKDHPDDLERKYYPCFHCKQIFLTQERRDNDWKDICEKRKKKSDAAFKMDKKAPRFECKSCNMKYYDEDEYGCHTVAEHLEAKPRYYCHICNIKFRISKELKKHNNQKHKAITKKLSEVFMCDLCGKFFPSKCLLKRHSIIHADIRPFECPMEDCSSRFKSRDVLKSHLATAHVTEKNHECNECGKKFKSRMFIKGHLYSHFPSLRKFVCDHCGERFSSSLRRKRHFRSHTGEKIFKCSLCDKSYAFRTGLQQHIQSNHTSIRYECKFCDKKLAGKRSMWKHIFTHRGYFPFYCPVCNYGCYPKELMRRHMKNKHTMDFEEKAHGYHKETFDEVIASGIKVNAENASNFRPNQVNLNTDFNYLTYMTIENSINDEMKPSTSTKNDNNVQDVNQIPLTPYLGSQYKQEF